MAVLIKTKVKGQTTEGYNGILAAVEASLKQAPGFIMHCAHPAGDTWDLYEVWQSKMQGDQWFAKNVVPNLPAGIYPKRSYEELHSMVTHY